jgi:hypothetical protein
MADMAEADVKDISSVSRTPQWGYMYERLTLGTCGGPENVNYMYERLTLGTCGGPENVNLQWMKEAACQLQQHLARLRAAAADAATMQPCINATRRCCS